jgi:hypothetical protein
MGLLGAPSDRSEVITTDGFDHQFGHPSVYTPPGAEMHPRSRVLLVPQCSRRGRFRARQPAIGQRSVKEVEYGRS